MDYLRAASLARSFDLCQELDELHQKRPALADAWELSTYHRKTARIRREINSILAKHPFIPVLELSEYTPGAGGFSVRWWPDPKRPVEIVISKDVDFAPVGPHAAIQITLELLREGSLSRIRRCRQPSLRQMVLRNHQQEKRMQRRLQKSKSTN